MKKQEIPETGGQSTPAFVRAVKDVLEVLCGRRKNKADLPEIRTLTFSAAPTKAELDAFNAYTNEWAKSLRDFATRFDD